VDDLANGHGERVAGGNGANGGGEGILSAAVRLLQCSRSYSNSHATYRISPHKSVTEV
jgi:hypothetical protein